MELEARSSRLGPLRCFLGRRSCAAPACHFFPGSEKERRRDRIPRSTVSSAEERRRAWVLGRRPTFVQGPRHCTTTEEKRRGFDARELPLAHEGSPFAIDHKNTPSRHHPHH